MFIYVIKTAAAVVCAFISQDNDYYYKFAIFIAYGNYRQNRDIPHLRASCKIKIKKKLYRRKKKYGLAIIFFSLQTITATIVVHSLRKNK